MVINDNPFRINDIMPNSPFPPGETSRDSSFYLNDQSQRSNPPPPFEQLNFREFLCGNRFSEIFPPG